jgi:urea transport system ATP-binding protein
MLNVDGVNQYYGGSHILRNVGFESKVGEVTAWARPRCSRA